MRALPGGMDWRIYHERCIALHRRGFARSLVQTLRRAENEHLLVVLEAADDEHLSRMSRLDIWGCNHLRVESVESIGGDVVAHLCLDCNEQLPDDWYP